MRSLSMPCALLFGLLGPAVARADSRGVVVRVDLKAAASPTGDVVAHLSAGGATKDVKVFDDGASPDVTAGDQVYSGTTWVEADTFDISLTIGDRTLPGGAVSWAATDAARDLTITVTGDSLTATAELPVQPIAGSEAEAASTRGDASGPPPLGDVAGAAAPGVAPGAPPSGAGPAGADPAGASPPGAPGVGLGPPPLGATSPGGAPLGPPTSAGSSTGTASASPLLYIGFGVGVLLLTWLVASRLRGRPGADLTPLPEPGLLGPTTPSVSAGPAIWQADAGDLQALADALLATLARHHRVIVAGAGYTPTPVYGGPVYRVEAASASAINKLIDDVEEEGGLPVVVLACGSFEGKALEGLANDVAEGVGPVIVTDRPGTTKLAVVACRRDGARWTFTTPAGEVRAQTGPNGLET